MQSHLVAMDQIQVWQQRLRLLMESLLSGFYPPGVVNAQPIGQAQRESMEREVGELKCVPLWPPLNQGELMAFDVLVSTIVPREPMPELHRPKRRSRTRLV